MLRARLILAMALLLMLLAPTAWGQSPRATDAPTHFDFPTFSNRLLQTQPLLSERPAHFVVMVDVSASVGNPLLGTWRSGLYESMLESFMVSGDKVSVVPFGLHPWWPDAHLDQAYARPQRAHLYTGSFPTMVKPPKYKGTDIYGSMAELLERARTSGWTKKDNLVLVVVSDDKIEDASEEGNKRFQALRASLLSSASDVMRLTWVSPKGLREYTVLIFTNSFPDTAKLAHPRNSQVEQERAAPGGGGPGGGPGSAGAGPSAGASPSTAASAAPSASPGVEAAAEQSGFWPPPWWFWLVLAVVVAALIYFLTRGPGGIRYRLDGAPGRLRQGDKPVDVLNGADKMGELRLQGHAILFHVQKPFRIAAGSSNVPGAKAAPVRGVKPPIVDPLLKPGRNGAFEAYDFEIVKESSQSASWSEASAAVVVGRVRVKVEVAQMTAAEAGGGKKPERVGSKGGPRP